MAGGQSVNYCDSVVLAFRLLALWCAHLSLGITQNEVQSWGQGASIFLRTTFSEFQSWGKIGWAAWGEPLGGGLNARSGFPRLCVTVLPFWLSKSGVLWPGSCRYSTWGGFNIKFTFFGIFGVTWDFDLAGRYSHILKSQHKHNTAIAVYSWIQMQTWCLLLVYTLNCHSACCLQSLGRNMQIEASVGPLFSSKFYLLIVWFLYFGLSHVYAPPILVWVAQEDIVLC